MEQHLFKFSLIIAGVTEKVLQFILPLQSTYYKNFGFFKQMCIFEQYKKVKKAKII
jgi:hypothetical protein